MPSSLTPSLIALSVPAAAAVVTAAARPRVSHTVSRSRRFVRIVGLTIAAQAVHFAEELTTRLHVGLPALFDLPPIDQSVFVGINLTALAVWTAALAAVRGGLAIALLPLWFVGFAEILNLFLHPLASIWTGGYFSGTITAPLVGVLGILTLRELVRVSAREVR